MKALMCILASLALSSPNLVAAEVATVVSTAAPEIEFEASDALHLPPDMYIGEAAGIAQNPKTGHLYVFHRGNTSGPAYGAAAAQLLEFDRNGKYLREIGKNLYAWSYAHNVRVDPEGNIWALDKGSDMVIRFNPAGQVTMVFGRKPEASDENAHPLEHVRPPLAAVDGQFRQVTDIGWDSKGNGYISDGYINSRVAKIGPDGQWLKSWGSFGKEPGQFDTLHSIQVANDEVFVADRGNRRIQVFDTEGVLRRIIQINIPAPTGARAAIGNTPDLSKGGFGSGVAASGAPWAICITPRGDQGKQVMFVADAFPGRIYKMDLEGHVIGYLGSSGKQLKQFGWIHEIACPSPTELYVAELLNWRVQKIRLRP